VYRPHGVRARTHEDQSSPAGQATRLAPSPTGALHLGNARTFIVNWALARRHGWQIVLRIDDLDGPRIKPGATDQTIRTLHWLGLDWDRGPIVQSADIGPYLCAMQRLARERRVYPCPLTRTQIEAAASAPQEGVHETRYPPSLRPAIRPESFNDPRTNWRLAVDDETIRFTDAFAGKQVHHPARSVGDFVVWTRRSVPAYQLAVVVDDHRQGVTQVVRGDDLLDSTARQMLLRRALGLGPEPAYTHLPLIVGPDGRRLAKRHGDTRLQTYRQAGTPPERIIGLLGSWCGMGGPHPDSPRSMSLGEFVERLDLDTMSRRPIVFTLEDHQWLLAGAR